MRHRAALPAFINRTMQAEREQASELDRTASGSVAALGELVKTLVVLS